MKHTEHREGARGEAREQTVAEALGWEYGVSMNTKKIGNVELLGVSGWDVEFVAMHNKMAYMLEANSTLGGNNELSIAEIFRGMERDSDLPLKISKRGYGQAGEFEYDLRQLAVLVRMKEVNRLLGKYRFEEKDLEYKFLNGESIQVEMKDPQGKTVVVDLRQLCAQDPQVNYRDFDFAEYLAKVKANQIGLQWMGTIRDEALVKKHIENSGHAVFRDTHRRDILGQRYESLWIPASQTMAAIDARTDINKLSVMKKADGHVHELGWYNELKGATVRFDYSFLRRHRSGMEYVSFKNTTDRVAKAAFGLNQYEDPMVAAGQEVEKNGKTYHQLAVLDIGKNRTGTIYEGMHDTYDKGMERVRGFKLTEAEADDLILTDVIAPFLTNSSVDWQMCLSKVIDGPVAYNLQKSAGTDGGQWAEKYQFCVKIRCKDLADGVVKEQYFLSIDELINYVNKRIELGEIDGVPKEVSVANFKGSTQKELAEAEEELAKGKEEKEEKKEQLRTKKYAEDNELRAHVKVLQDILGEQTQSALAEFVDKDAQTKVTIDGAPKDLIDYMRLVLRERGVDYYRKHPAFSFDVIKVKIYSDISQTPEDVMANFLKSISAITEDENREIADLEPDALEEEELRKDMEENKKKYRTTMCTMFTKKDLDAQAEAKTDTKDKKKKKKDK